MRNSVHLVCAEIRQEDKQKKDESEIIEKSDNIIIKREGNALIIIFLNDKLKDKENKRIKTTIGFSQETYTLLKALSVATNEHMQDIIEKALREYFEKEDVKRILITYFASTGFRRFGNYTGPKFPQ